MNKLKNLTDKHIKFINLNHWINGIDFNNIDIIECKSINVYLLILSLISNRVIQCNIIIDNNKNRYYYNGKPYYNKKRLWVSNNQIYDYLMDINGNELFRCKDKTDWWIDYKINFKPYNDFHITKVDKNDLIIIYNE